MKNKKKNRLLLRRIILFLFGLGIGLILASVARQLFWSESTKPIMPPGMSQEESKKRAFIDALKPVALDIYREFGILPSISIGQAALESDFGQSRLASEFYNLYGIKAGPNQPSVSLATSEFENGEWVEIQAPFRVYTSWRESMVDHAKLLTHGTTWNQDLYSGVTQASGYKQAAHQLQQAGYATDPTYSDKVIGIIETYQLMTYDAEAERSGDSGGR